MWNIAPIRSGVEGTRVLSMAALNQHRFTRVEHVAFHLVSQFVGLLVQNVYFGIDLLFLSNLCAVTATRLKVKAC